MGKTHAIIGAAVGTSIIVHMNLSLIPSIIVLSTSILGSLLADLDHPNGFLNQKIGIKNKKNKKIKYTILSIAFFVSYYYYRLNFLGFLGIISFLTGVSKHRGFTHSIFAVGLYALSLNSIAITYEIPYLFTSFLCGYISHLIADMLTNRGIALFYPIKKNYKFPITITTKSNGFTENCIHVLASIYIIFSLFTQLLPNF